LTLVDSSETAGMPMELWRGAQGARGGQEDSSWMPDWLPDKGSTQGGSAGQAMLLISS
jgi:hypothetical protein